jgi:catechol 2,3-dioxygenase-like lactoylglutathione lyase family enzyme
MIYLRVARPTDDLETMVRMYHDGLGLEILGQFDDHDGFDGVILGKWDLAYQIEFTHQRGHAAGRAPSRDNLLVFYHPQRSAWRRVCEKMAAAGFKPVAAWNPYWNARGRTFEDPEGWRVVIQNTEAPFQGGTGMGPLEGAASNRF